jgi:hypothetical protein
MLIVSTMVLFKRINEFPDYFIDFNGNIFGKNGFLKAHLDGNGYLFVVLYHNKKRNTKKVHRLVAQTFLNNPNNFPAVDHIDRNKSSNNVNNLRWVTIQKNGHNRVDNNEHLNIMRRNDRDGYRVQFSIKSRKTIDRTFDNISDAIEFRDIIQKSIDNREDICQIFVDLFKNEMKHITVTKYGKYRLVIQKPTLKFKKTFLTLDTAKKNREELLKVYYHISI